MRRTGFSGGSHSIQLTTCHITVIRQLKRSPVQIKPRGGKENALLSRANAVRESNLSRIREESTELEGFREDTYRDLHTNNLRNDDDDDAEDVDDDVAEWDEESTLVALLDSECVYAPLFIHYPR